MSFFNIRMLIAALLFSSVVVDAAERKIFLEENFKDGVNEDSEELWQWDYTSQGTSTGMMYGEGDIYEISDETYMSDRSSLRLNFNGRNNFCNICGGVDYELTTTEDELLCFQFGNQAHQKSVYNKTAEFSTWPIVSERGDTACIAKTRPNMDNVGGVDIDSKLTDTVHLPNKCGVNGTVGGNIDRRSDCNRAVNYLKGVSAADLSFGETISRRFYMYVPLETELPEVTFKLGYSYWAREGESLRSATLKISTQRGNSLELSMPSGTTTTIGRDVFKLTKGKWFYFEEIFTRESALGRIDATYTLYASPEDQYSNEPIIVDSNFNLGELRKMTIGGNWQHFNEVSGYVYFDNILISNMYAGPVNRPLMPDVVLE